MKNRQCVCPHTTPLPNGTPRPKVKNISYFCFRSKPDRMLKNLILTVCLFLCLTRVDAQRRKPAGPPAAPRLRRTAPAAARHAADRRPGGESDPVQQQRMELLPTFLAYARLAAGLCPALGHLSGLRVQEHRVCRPAARNRLENRQGSERVHSARRRKRTVEVRSSPSSQPQRGG